MKQIHKKVLFYCIAVVLLLLVIDLVSYTFFRIFHERFTFYDVHQYVVRDEEIPVLEEWYDAALGWDYHYETPFTERPRPQIFGRPLISSFGDSYSHCTDVEDDESWQTYLSRLLEADVYNFGTGGFGTGQAYLKCLVVQPKLQTEIVILGVTPENINRVVNVYRPFYFSKTGIRLPKPRFELSDGRLELLDNPVAAPDEIAKLTNEKFIHSLGKNDYWYNRDNYPVFGFPYTRILFNKRMWLEAFHGKMKKRPVSDVDPRPWEDPWENNQARELMFALIDAFVENVTGNGQIPIIMISPMEGMVFHRFVTNANHDSVVKLSDYCRRRNYTCFNAVDVLAQSVTNMEEIPELYNVHVSAKGNRIIADALFAFLNENYSEVLEP